MKKQRVFSSIVLIGVALFTLIALTGCNTGDNDAPVINANAMGSGSSGAYAYTSTDQSDDQSSDMVVVPSSDIQVVSKSMQDQSAEDNVGHEQAVSHRARSHHAHHASTENTANNKASIPVEAQYHSEERHSKAKKTLKSSKKTKNNEVKRSGWIWPANGKVLASFSATHPGVEIQGSAGSAVVAVDAGTVIYSQNNVNRYGNMIIIDHGNHVMTAYAYNDNLLVHPEDQVSAGQKIATMGKNPEGQSCVYFEVRRNGKPVDPFAYLSKTP